MALTRVSPDIETVTEVKTKVIFRESSQTLFMKSVLNVRDYYFA
jgi:hypothetical protein